MVTGERGVAASRCQRRHFRRWETGNPAFATQCHHTVPHNITTQCKSTTQCQTVSPHSARVPHSVITKCNRVMVTGPHSTTVQLYHGGPTNQPTNHQQHHSATAPQYHITTVPQHHSATVICEAFVQYRALSCSAESASL